MTVRKNYVADYALRACTVSFSQFHLFLKKKQNSSHDHPAVQIEMSVASGSVRFTKSRSNRAN